MPQVFFWWPPDENITPKQPGKVSKRDQLNSQTTRWILDPKAKTLTRITPAFVWNINGEFSRIDDRWVTKKYRHFWQAKVDPSKPYDFEKCGPPAGGLFNSLGMRVSNTTLAPTRKMLSNLSTASQSFIGLQTSRQAMAVMLFICPPPPQTYVWTYVGDALVADYEYVGHYTWDPDNALASGTEDTYFFGPTSTVQEPSFIPKSEDAAEGEGYLIALVNRLDELRNDVAIFDAQNLAQGPLAVIHLPLKLKLGLHGNFVDHRDIEAWQRRRDAGGDVGPVKIATEPLPWQKELANGTVNGQNGVNGSH